MSKYRNNDYSKDIDRLTMTSTVPIVAMVQARWNSKRFPGKALAEIDGKPALQRIIDNCRESKLIDRVIVVTARSPEIIKYCIAHQIDCYAHSNEWDIVGRFTQAWRYWYKKKSIIIVRVWGDCPLIRPWLITTTVKYFLAHSYRYVYNDKYGKGQTVGVCGSDLYAELNDTLRGRQDLRNDVHTWLTHQSYTGVLKATHPDHENYCLDYPEDIGRIETLLHSPKWGKKNGTNSLSAVPKEPSLALPSG